MKVGDLVRFKGDQKDAYVVVWVESDIAKKGAYCRVHGFDGTEGNFWMGRLEVINENR